MKQSLSVPPKEESISLKQAKIVLEQQLCFYILKNDKLYLRPIVAMLLQHVAGLMGLFLPFCCFVFNL